MPRHPQDGSSRKVLVDTNVWIFFFRKNPEAQFLASLLVENRVLTHPWVIGEMMLGTLGARREKILADLCLLPQLLNLNSQEVFDFINHYKLYGKGLSLVDIQLLSSCKAQKTLLWTFDKKLQHEAKKMGCAFLF